MPRDRIAVVPCPHARPEDACRLAPGVRFCVCHGGEHDAPVGHVIVRDGQLLWVVRDADGREVGGYTYVAVLPRASGLETVELEGAVELRIVQTREGRRPFYKVRARGGREVAIEASTLMDAACEGKEFVPCRFEDGAE